MLRRNLAYGIAAGGSLALLAALAGLLPVAAQPPARQQPEQAVAQAPPATLTKAVIDTSRPASKRQSVAIDPVVIGNCRLAVIRKVDVPAQHDGVLLAIGRELKDGEQCEPERLITAKVPGQPERKYRELREGDEVTFDQQLAQLDDRLARDDCAIAQAKITSGQADQAASEKTRDETKERWATAEKLTRAGGKGAMSEEDRRGAKLTYERYFYEAISKKEAVELATREFNKANTTLAMHEIRAPLAGRLKTIYRQKGEAVKNLEPVFQVQNYDRLRVEGLVEVQYLPELRVGQEVVVEPSRQEPPEQTMLGHRMEVTGVAISKDKNNPLFVSSSVDGSVRVWSRASRFARREYLHPAAVRCVACTPPGAEANLCVSGAADGVARLFDLDKDSDQPLRELKGEHRGQINCVAFSPDGKLCATGGEDRNICLWDVATGALKYRLPSPAHRGGVTALNFTPQSQLVSAGTDRTLRVWALSAQEAHPLGKEIAGRTGDVPQLGISADGKHALFDKGRELYLLSLPGGGIEGVLQSPSRGNAFSTLAIFSPDGQLALTAGESEGKLQLWRVPTENVRGHEVRQWISPERSPATCAAISPDGSFAVTGSRDRQVYVWAMPKKEELAQAVTAKISYIEHAVESSARQVRIWAEFDNSKLRLMPGTSATLVAYPQK